MLFMPFLPEQDRHKEESDHIIQKMRNKADQAVAGPAVQDRKKDRVDKESAKIPRNDPRRTCGIVRRGKECSPGNSHRPERKALHALPHEERAEFDLFTEHGDDLTEQQQRKLTLTLSLSPA